MTASSAPFDQIGLRNAGTTPGQVLAIVSAGLIMANLDLFIVNVALPNIRQDFGDPALDDMSWVLNGYAIVYAALLVFFGRLAERHRRDHGFLVGIALFTAASARAPPPPESGRWSPSGWCRRRARR